MEFNVKVWRNFHWKKRILIIREKDFLVKKTEKPPKKKKANDEEIRTYNILNAIVLDQSKNNDYEILIASKDYKVYVKTTNAEDKTNIIQGIENSIKENTFQNVYKEYNEKVAQYNVGENEMSTEDFLCCKLFLFRNLMNEMNQKIEELKNIVKPKPKTKSESELMRIYNSVNAVKVEMEKQFQQVLTYMNKYFDINENFRKKTIKLNSLLTDKIRMAAGNEKDKNEIKEYDISSDEESIRKSNANFDKTKNENIEDNKENIIKENNENLEKENKNEIINDNKDNAENIDNKKKDENINENKESIDNKNTIINENKENADNKNEIINGNNENLDNKNEIINDNKEDIANTNSNNDNNNKGTEIKEVEENNVKKEENNFINGDNKNVKNNINEGGNNFNFNFNFNFQYNFLSYNNSDFKNTLYNFNKRTKYPKSIIYPQNIIKEMITAMTQNKPAPVYFNEPLSMGQRQCEKFYYLSLLKKVCQESKNKSLQIAYISAFIIGELFLSLNRNLKPFNPIIGETYEYFDNEKNFRYCSEQVSHNPQITAFFGETPDFALYGDTKNSTSFKILKGAMELTFKNKVHLHIKSTNDHFVYNRPNVMVKGFLKPPLHNDYNGTITIENELFPENKGEIKFIEESWTNSTLGLFEGKIYCGDKVIYLIKGNWNNNIYLVDNDDKEKKIDLLSIEQNQEYLKNGKEGNYELPTFCYNLNYMDKNLEQSLPMNDSRFRKDMRLLEESADTKEAQIYKEKYEEKQRKELNNENHKVLFFDEKFDKEGENYFIPNGKYWEMKNKGELKNNPNSQIFDVSKY